MGADHTGDSISREGDFDDFQEGVSPLVEDGADKKQTPVPREFGTGSAEKMRKNKNC
jgi:hypothetical protein